MKNKEVINFYCKECDNSFSISKEKALGFWNYKCPNCGLIAQKEGTQYGNVIWKCKVAGIERRNG